MRDSPVVGSWTKLSRASEAMKRTRGCSFGDVTQRLDEGTSMNGDDNANEVFEDTKETLRSKSVRNCVASYMCGGSTASSVY